VHGVLEDNVSSGSILDLDQMKVAYEEHKANLDPKQQIPAELTNAGVQILEDFYDIYSGRDFNVYEKEMGFNFVIGNYSVIGYMDRVDMYDDMVEIVDYKTGKREVAQKDIAKNLQLGIYALAASTIFPGKKIKGSLHYLRSGRIKSHEYSDEDLVSIKEELVNRINRIINDFNYSPTKNERFCSFCDHAKSGACATGAARLKKANY
jgi:RecB family exonuclease